MAKVGRIGEFVEGKEEFGCYVERMEQFFAANEIADDKRVPVFLAVVGAQTYALLRNLITPDLPSTKTYDELKTVLSLHYRPKPLVIAERFRFHNRKQTETENVSEYLASLKKLSYDCDFGNFLNQALRDRLVCGLKNELIQKRLLAEVDLDLKKATEIALAMEMAAKHTTEIMSKPVVPVNQVTRGGRRWHREQKSGPGIRGPRAGDNAKPKYDGKKPCFRCGGKHAAEDCKFKNEKCFECKKTGHIGKMCRSKKNLGRNQYVGFDTDEEDVDFGLYSLYHTQSNKTTNKEYRVTLSLDGNPVSLELDTGAAVTIVSEGIYKAYLKHLPMQKSSVKLKDYGGERVPILGEVKVPVVYGNQRHNLPLRVVQGNKPSLLGRDWLEDIKLDWTNIFSVKSTSTTNSTDTVNELLRKHEKLFEKSLGTIRDFTAQVRINPEVQPIFCKARPVPFSLKEMLEKELMRLEEAGIISRVERSDWATPIVVVPKADKSIRVCGDFKVTVNQCLDEQQYPLPNVEDMFAQLAGGNKFTKLDLSQAYQQLTLDEASKPYLTINTHLGLFRYHRLPFGVSSAPAIFQSVMDQVLSGLKHVMCRIDDILITAPTDREHLMILEEVLRRLDRHNIRLRKDKCKFLQSRVEYMGHLLDHEGIHPTEAKVEAIRGAPCPMNVSELKSFLGLLNYYGQYLPNLSTTLQPLHELLRQETSWEWTPKCETAFRSCKDQLSSDRVLVHYDTGKPLRLACDASAYGLGAVISHVFENGEERPIAYASRTLAPSERNYAQIEKEALGLVFGVKKFHKYLYGRQFTLVTDHKPLTRILGPKTGVPTLAAARMQRWALILSAYQYNIEYRKGATHANADAFSRLPIQSEGKSEEAEIYHFTQLDELPVMSDDIGQETRKDPVLSKVLDYTLNGWPNYVSDRDLQPYFQRRDQLSSEQGCVLWGLRVVIPPLHRERLLADLHEQHVGMCRMKSLARSYLWWPGLDKEIETLVNACGVCQATRNVPPVAPLHCWNWPTRVWQRLHIDFAEKDKQNFLVVIDSHSKWLEVFNMTTTTSSKTIETLRSLFASYGLPEEIVSDNGPQFTSGEFQQFMKKNGVKHTLVPPYHPASNGAAERSVQILKRTLLKQVLDGDGQYSVQHRLSNFLLKYRSTPHSVTGVAPTELFLKRQLRTKFSLLKPDMERRICRKQEMQKIHHDKGRVKVRTFAPDQTVRVRNFRGGHEKWIPGKIVKQLGPVTYLVRVGPNIRYTHVDHLLASGEELLGNGGSIRVPTESALVEIPSVPPETLGSPGSTSVTEILTRPTSQKMQTSESVSKPIPVSTPSSKSTSNPNSAARSPNTTTVEVRRNPPRTRQAPVRLDL